MPAHSGPVARTAAATRSPNASAMCVLLHASRVARSSSALAFSSGVVLSRAGRPARMSATVVSWSRHQRASWRSTCHGARGSRKVAVPTWTASAPGLQQLDGVAARLHAADPDDRRVGERRPALPDGADRHRVHRGPESPPPPAPRTGRPVSVSRARPEQRVHQREPVRTALERARRDLHDVGHVGAELGPARQAALGGRHDPGRRLGRVGEHARAGPRRSGQLTLTSSAAMQRPARCSPPRRRAPRRARSPPRCGPRCSPRPRARLRRARAGRARPTRRGRGPAARRC